MNVNQPDSKLSRSNTSVVSMCVGMVLGMGGLAYASVPLYELFCQVTGYGGTTQRAELTDAINVIDRKINVRFDANTASNLDWKFAPEQRQVSLKMGETMVVNYVAENLSDEPIVGMASFNVTPQATGVFFNKVECFCFTDTYIQPGGKLEMPVVFYVDPDMDKEETMKGLSTITLSYTFYESDTTPEEMTAEQAELDTGVSENGNL
ncbi:MAG: cytochrome c oxidase assembly protein [Rhizobiaceae bacterium]|nr:cytochrome c oxidase assembly protein [Rhizobiaceae bacterium]